MAKPKTTPDTPPIPFEKAIEDLETIVKDMESSRLPLDVLLEKYELGNHLLKVCQQRIDQAELRIERIASGAEGIQLEPFEAAETEQPQPQDQTPEQSAGEDDAEADADDPDSSDEIKLF